jgi:hypothetical protein
MSFHTAFFYVDNISKEQDTNVRPISKEEQSKEIHIDYLIREQKEGRNISL